jgi:hypothetical protein
MPWELRGQKRYYYRSERVAGRPVRRYFGSGPAAELQAAADDLRRLRRETQARERGLEEARLREAEAPLTLLCGLTDLLAHAALAAAGYHRHDRGPWRRRRDTDHAG